MILGITDSRLVFDCAERLVNATGLCIGHGRSGTVHRRVEIVRSEQPGALRANVCASDYDLERQLLLDIEIPLLCVRRAEISVERRSRRRGTNWYAFFCASVVGGMNG